MWISRLSFCPHDRLVGPGRRTSPSARLTLPAPPIISEMCSSGESKHTNLAGCRGKTRGEWRRQSNAHGCDAVGGHLLQSRRVPLLPTHPPTAIPVETKVAQGLQASGTCYTRVSSAHNLCVSTLSCVHHPPANVTGSSAHVGTQEYTIQLVRVIHHCLIPPLQYFHIKIT